MSTILFGRTQTSFQTPFESEPERSNGFTSKNSQEAIEEALAVAISNDRFIILPSYGGNANTGRYLELWPTISTVDAPLNVGVSLKCLYMTASTVSVSATCTIGFYNMIPSPTLVFTAVLSNQKSVIYDGSPTAPLFSLPSDGQLAIKVDSGSINKPYLLLSLSATI